MRAALLLIAALTATAHAQWTILTTNTTANLRGIHSLGNGLAWASGDQGTILRTEDNGQTWHHCTIPPNAEKLDFRGIQAFDNKTAIVMSSGPGDQSRLYKTTDGCDTWKLLFTNPDKDGFWDGIFAPNRGARPMIIGDPVDGHFVMFAAENNLADQWHRLNQLTDAPDLKLPTPHSKNESLFAASNSILYGSPDDGFSFATGGQNGSFFYTTVWHAHALFDYRTVTFAARRLPLANGESAGAFSFTTSPGCNMNQKNACAYVVVGGDYKRPDERTGTAAYAIVSDENPGRFKPAQTPPHGYRSAIAYNGPTKTWITVGPNGTDISTDDGRNWHPLKPSATDPPDADKNWNALSLPFAAGPKGRIGLLHQP